MSVVDDTQRAAIEERAGHRCEYCHLPTRGQVATFPIDHAVPRSSGGLTELENLALACPHCNGHKWAHTTGVDPLTGEAVPLFNPRKDNWTGHFRWSPDDGAIIEGKTPCGRGTIDRLRMNHPTLVEIRRLLIALGVLRSEADE